MFLEATVAQQGSGQVADSDHDHRPLPVNAEPIAKGGHQFLGRIADARLAKVAQTGQVLAHLGVGDAQGDAQLTAGNGLHSLAVEPFQMAKIKAETPDAGSGQARLAAVTAGRDRC